MKLKTVFFIITLFLSLHTLHAQSCPQLVRQWNDGPCKAIATTDDLVLFGSGANLIIGDLAEDNSIHRISETDMTGVVLGISIAGDLAAVASDYAGVQLLDISQPENPNFLAQIQPPQSSFRVILNGNYMYAVSHRTHIYPLVSTLSIYNYSNTSSPNLVGQLSIGDYVKDVVLFGSKLYVADFYGGLRVIDVSDPSNPALIGELNEAWAPHSLCISESTLYVAIGGNGVAIFALSTSPMPTFVGYVDLVGSSDLIFGLHDHLFIGTEKDGIHILDISEPTLPEYLSTIESKNMFYSLGGRNTELYVSDSVEGLLVYNLDDAENPTLLSTEALSGRTLNVIGDQNLLIANEFPVGVRIYEISEDYIIHPINLLSKTDRFLMAYNKPYLYTCTTQDSILNIYDLTDPYNVTQTAELNLPATSTEIAVNDKHLFISSVAWTQVINIEDPYNPVALPDLPYPSGSLAVHNSTLALNKNITVLNVSDPENPILLFSNQSPAENIEIDANYVYYGTGTHLWKANYHNPVEEITASPERHAYYQGELSVDYPYAVMVDDYSSTSNVIVVYDLSNEYDETPVGENVLLGEGYGCFVKDNYAWIALSDAGIALFELSGCGKVPSADFIYRPNDNLHTREMIKFRDNSTNRPSAWYWDFGDGGESAESEPIHFYQNAGVYNVTLTVSNTHGSSSISKTITVLPNDIIPPIDTEGDYVYLIPSVATGAGAKNSNWRTSVQLLNGWYFEWFPHAYLYYMKESASVPDIEAAVVDFGVSSVETFDDILYTVFGETSSRGAILVKSNGPVYFTAAIVNDQGEEGLLAQKIPTVNVKNMTTSDIKTIGLLFVDQPVRMNWGVVNLSSEVLFFINPFSVQSAVYMAPYSYWQFDQMPLDIMNRFPYIELWGYSTSEEEPFFYTFVSVIDNRNGNPIFLPMQE